MSRLDLWYEWLLVVLGALYLFLRARAASPGKGRATTAAFVAAAAVLAFLAQQHASDVQRPLLALHTDLRLFKNIPMVTSGDWRVIAGPDRVVPSPFGSLPAANLIAAAVTSALHAKEIVRRPDTFSIVIPARDEDLYLTRTVQYIFAATPESLLEEIIVIDDASDNPQEEVLRRELPAKQLGKVRVIRNSAPEGLIRSRIVGARRAKGAYLLFLDAHCKPDKGWLEPLLSNLQANWKRIACPTIWDIDRERWERVGTYGTKMMFEWTFEFGWYVDEAAEVPLSSGGIFAITRDWWTYGGEYDDEMYEWGGENLEQSFRMWLCGGEVVVVRESNVGHIFNRPEKANPPISLVRQVQRNQKRVALVWLDDYYRFFFENHKEVQQLEINGTLDRRLELRKNLDCLNFRWYVKKFRNSFERNRLLEDDYLPIAFNGGPGPRCLGLDASKKVILENCSAGSPRWAAAAGDRVLQTKEGDCLTITANDANKGLHVQNCEWDAIASGGAQLQYFRVDQSRRNVFHPFVDQVVLPVSATLNDRPPLLDFKRHCLVAGEGDRIAIEPCAAHAERQLFSFAA